MVVLLTSFWPALDLTLTGTRLMYLRFICSFGGQRGDINERDVFDHKAVTLKRVCLMQLVLFGTQTYSSMYGALEDNILDYCSVKAMLRTADESM